MFNIIEEREFVLQSVWKSSTENSGTLGNFFCIWKNGILVNFILETLKIL